MNKKIKIGTRKSLLALAQTEQVAKELKEIDAQLEIEFIPMSTQGDRNLDKPLEAFGGKGAFISEFEEAILRGEIDLAVHSAKDMPMILADKLAILGVSRREDVRDVLVFREEEPHVLTSESVVGTSSLRRKLLMEENTGVQIKTLRGNVNTRLTKLQNKEFDAIILACAGLKRLDLLDNKEFYYEYLEPDTYIPAAGQGIIAVEGRKDDEVLVSLLKKWSNVTSLYSLETEREVIRLLNSGCNEPVGVYSSIVGDEIILRILYKFDNKIINLCDKSKLADRLALAKDMVKRIYN